MPVCRSGRDDSERSEGCKIKTELHPGHPPTLFPHAAPHKPTLLFGPWRPTFHPPRWCLSSQRTECIKHGGRLDRGCPGRLFLPTPSRGTMCGPLWPVTLTTHTPSFLSSPCFFVMLFLFLCVTVLCGVITALALFICVCEISIV